MAAKSLADVAKRSHIARPFDHGMRLEEFLVDLDTDAGPVERPHAAILADLPGLRPELVAELVGNRQIRLEVATIVDRGQEVDRHGMVEARHGAMRVDRQL